MRRVSRRPSDDGLKRVCHEHHQQRGGDGGTAQQHHGGQDSRLRLPRPARHVSPPHCFSFFMLLPVSRELKEDLNLKIANFLESKVKRTLFYFYLCEY